MAVKIKITIERILYWLFFAFLIYIAYELIRKILGYSLGFEQLMIALLVTNLGYSFYLMRHVSTEMSALKERVKNLDNKFSALASDFKTHIKHK